MNEYGLCIAEDDGEVDLAFPCLDANEPCSKFGFTCLGLIDLKTKIIIDRATDSIPDYSVMSGAFHVFPKASDSGQSHHNTSRHNTGGSSTSEAVRSAIRAINEGMLYLLLITRFCRRLCRIKKSFITNLCVVARLCSNLPHFIKFGQYFLNKHCNENLTKQYAS